MPKVAEYCLTWSLVNKSYELHDQQRKHLLTITPGEHEWFVWLDSVPSFAFHGQHGQLTARKESSIEHLPPQVHLVLATRADPPLPLARLRARGQLIEIRTSDLRFSSEDVGAFLHIVMGLDLPPEHLITLERHTEGWVAGLRLAALSLRGRAPSHVSGFLSAFTGSHRFVLDFLSEEVLSQQPAAVSALHLDSGAPQWTAL